MLDHLLLRSFVAVAESGNFTRAAERLHLTQSTVSQQLRRLEQSLDCQLLDRRQRHVRPTAEGERLLGYARRILALHAEAEDVLGNLHNQGVLRIGVPEDFASDRLMPMLAQFAEQHPGLRLEVTSGLSPELYRLYHHNELDLALVKQTAAGADAVAVWPEPLCWVDSATRPAIERNPLPLVTFPPNGLYRQEMTHALDTLGRRWRISYSSASLAGVCSAVSAGLGISLLPQRVLSDSHRILDQTDGLPAMAPMQLALYSRLTLHDAGKALERQLQSFGHHQAQC